MTVNTTEITSGPYSGNDVADEFAYTFRVENKNQLQVYETDDDSVETLLTVDTDYTVADIGVDGGGTITRVAGALPTGYTWYIRSNYATTQDTAFASQGGFFPAIHESAFDKLTFLIQQLYDLNDRTFRLSPSDSDFDSDSITLPATGDRASKVLVFDSDGNLTVGNAIGTFRGDWANGREFNERDLFLDDATNNVYYVLVAHTATSIAADLAADKIELLIDAEYVKTQADAAAADAIATAADRVQTGLDVIATAADRVQTGLDAVATAADRVQTGLDADATAADVIATAADRVQTGLDADATAADRVQTGLDADATAADRVQTGLDAVATAADRVQTGLDADATAADAVATAADRVQTGLDADATAADRVQTGLDADATAADVIAVAGIYDDFDDSYLGAKGSDPTVDNDGDALLTGALYWRTTTPVGLRVYNGTSWTTINLYTHPNHSGEVTSTGDGAQVVTVSAITNKTELTSGLAATDEFLVNDGGVIKRMDASVLAELYLRTDNTGDKSVNGNAYLAQDTLTDGAAIIWTATNGTEAFVTLGGNRVLLLNAVPPAGTWLTLLVRQDATGNRTLAYNGNYFNFGDEGTPVLSTGGNRYDVLSFRSNGIRCHFMGIKLGFTS